MNNEKNPLVRLFDFIRDLFEHMSPSLFALMATLLPYLSPLPISSFTVGNATRYLGFTPTISGIFVFVLEALGLWVTSVLVDSIIEFIRSRNSKTFIMILVFGAVTSVYITILINLNVNLEMSDNTKALTPTYRTVVTLISIIPLLTGFMNGWYKAKLDNKKAEEEAQKKKEQDSRSAEERAREDARIASKEKQRERLVRQAIKQGMTPEQAMVFMQDAPMVLRQDDVLPETPEEQGEQRAPALKKLGEKLAGAKDWRTASKILSAQDKTWIAWAPVDEVATICNIPKRTAYEWKKHCRT